MKKDSIHLRSKKEFQKCKKAFEYYCFYLQSLRMMKIGVLIFQMGGSQLMSAK